MQAYDVSARKRAGAVPCEADGGTPPYHGTLNLVPNSREQKSYPQYMIPNEMQPLRTREQRILDIIVTYLTIS